jgi:transcriptional regulator with XRE-family HTH domain/tetratricopeptide (TPR) repeat protein
MALARGAGDGAVLARLLNLVGVTRIFTDPPGALEVLAETIVLSRRHDETTTLVSALAMQGFARALCGDLDAAAESLQECLDDGSGFGDSQPLVMGLVGMGHVRLHQGDTAGARTCLDEGLAMARRVHNPIWVALALGYQADLEAAFGSHHRARQLAGEAVEVARLTGGLPVIGLCLAMAGNVELAAGNPASSLPLFDEALQRVTGERGGVRSRALVGRGRALVDLGDSEAALALLQEAVTLAEDVRNRIAAAAALHELGRCAARLGDHGSALERYRASLTANSLAGHRMAVPGSLEAIACETAHVGDVIRALRLAAAADAIRARTGMARSGEDEVNYETVAALADKVLEPDVQAAAIDAGGQLTAEQLVPYACARPMSLSIYAGVVDGSFVRRVRESRDLSQHDLAEISGISQPNISAIENGRRSPSADTLNRLLVACGYELAAVAGERIIHCPLPHAGWFPDDDLPSRLDGDPPDEEPSITPATPMADRVRAVNAVLEAATLGAPRPR